MEGGRIGEKSSYGLTQQLKEMGIRSDRMKTGTPPRIDIRSVDPDKPTEPKGLLEWWMIVIIVVVVLGIVIVGVILIKKKKTVTSDNLEHGPDGGLLGDYNSLSSKETV